jgi:hypothetical protein
VGWERQNQANDLQNGGGNLPEAGCHSRIEQRAATEQKPQQQ